MRQLAAPLLALAFLAAPLSAADNAAPAVPDGLELSMPVVTSLNMQLTDLAKFRASDPAMVAAKLAALAGPGRAINPAGDPDAVSALMLGRALTDSRELKTLFEGLQDAPDGRGAAASQKLADLREALYGASTPAAVKDAFERALRPLEGHVADGRTLDLGGLSSLYDGSAAKKAGARTVFAPRYDQYARHAQLVAWSARADKAVETGREAPPPPSGGRDTGIAYEGRPSIRVQVGMPKAYAQAGPLPAGVTMEIRSRSETDDNPQVVILVDGRQVYWEYLYHSERNLARQSLSWNPRTWLAFWRARNPSGDITWRLAATLELAKLARTGPLRLERGDDWLARP